MRNRLSGGGEHFAINLSRALLAEPVVLHYLSLIFGEQPGERLVVAAIILREVLLRILVAQIPLGIMHETQRFSRCGPGAADPSQRPFAGVPEREIIAGMPQNRDAVADRRRQLQPFLVATGTLKGTTGSEPVAPPGNKPAPRRGRSDGQKTGIE